MKATLFEFSSYKYESNKNRIFFHYKTRFEDGFCLTFTETILLPKAPNKNTSKELFKKLLQDLHLVLGISYYKFYCAKNIKLPYNLNKEEAEFWNTVYKRGL